MVAQTADSKWSKQQQRMERKIAILQIHARPARYARLNEDVSIDGLRKKVLCPPAADFAECQRSLTNRPAWLALIPSPSLPRAHVF